ncbi:hypothetical protein SKAU_G00023980 [Synaphobranchus kaupii]|uniref:Uncharacterized protein n=1 Tax=Synaphobranchus kaupii TaxID=118154 RepID=A0A9Q1GCG3_SYNKA|nr:hypothetical protein SKAU_G00023980 [Synaphobranchus kaupii]
MDAIGTRQRTNTPLFTYRIRVIGRKPMKCCVADTLVGSECYWLFDWKHDSSHSQFSPLVRLSHVSFYLVIRLFGLEAKLQSGAPDCIGRASSVLQTSVSLSRPSLKILLCLCLRGLQHWVFHSGASLAADLVDTHMAAARCRVYFCSASPLLPRGESLALMGCGAALAALSPGRRAGEERSDAVPVSPLNLTVSRTLERRLEVSTFQGPRA